MKRFITTISLHSASNKDYEHLHSEMEKEAFIITRKIKFSNQPQSTLYAEEYKKRGETLKDINDAVFRAVRKVGRKYSFSVMKENRV